MDNVAPLNVFVEGGVPDDALWPGFVVPASATRYAPTPIAPTVLPVPNGPVVDVTFEANRPGVVGILAHTPGDVIPTDAHYMPGNTQRYRKGLATGDGGPVGRSDYGGSLYAALAQQGVVGPSDEAIQAALAEAM